MGQPALQASWLSKGVGEVSDGAAQLKMALGIVPGRCLSMEMRLPLAFTESASIY